MVRPQKKLTWLVSGISPKAPASFSIWMWVLDTLGQAAENSRRLLFLRMGAVPADTRAREGLRRGGIRAEV